MRDARIINFQAGDVWQTTFIYPPVTQLLRGNE
jgi:hypothetical protein